MFDPKRVARVVLELYDERGHEGAIEGEEVLVRMREGDRRIGAEGVIDALEHLKRARCFQTEAETVPRRDIRFALMDINLDRLRKHL